MKRAGEIRLLVADDHLIFRIGLVQSLQFEADMTVVGEAATGMQAIEMYQKLRPDILLIDVCLPILDGVETTAALRKEFPDARIIVLTTREAHEGVYRALQAGACACLMKSTVREELFRAIRAIHSGQSCLPDGMADRMAHRRVAGCARPPEQAES